jgi:5'-nucleotidase
MFEPISDLAKARILISNDDGIDAPGIKVLERIAKTLSKDVWVVAPASEQSAVAHSLTVRRPLRIQQVGRRRYTVDGTPTDSVLLALRHILKDKRPHLLLSGINSGGNVGEDVTYSGTVAAAMEGTLLGIPSIALSQKYTGDMPLRWSTAEHWAGDVIRRVAAVGWPQDVLINVNFPDVPHAQVTGIEVVRQGKRQYLDPLSEREDPHGHSYFWIGGTRVEDPGLPGTDLSAISRGAVAVTPLCVDFTSAAAMDRLVTAFQ